MNRIFNATGQTVGEVIRVRRLARAREDLIDSDLSVSAIAHRWGFSDPSHFTRSFKAHYGASPREYRTAGRVRSTIWRLRYKDAMVTGPVRLGSPLTKETQMARRDIEFDAEGVTLRGWFYDADGASGAAPTVVMAHGFSAVKEMYLDKFAEAFAAAGLNALVFDNRNFGASDGEPRQEIDPVQQVRDYRHAITYATTLDEVDPTRIGVWGSSYSGGHVLVLGAIDRRVKAVVAQVPLVSGSANVAELVRADFRAGFRQMFDDDRAARFRGDPPAMVPVVAEDPLAPSALPTPDSWTWFTETGKTRAPSWNLADPGSDDCSYGPRRPAQARRETRRLLIDGTDRKPRSPGCGARVVQPAGPRGGCTAQPGSSPRSTGMRRCSSRRLLGAHCIAQGT